MVKFTYNDFFAYDEILNKTQINNINEKSIKYIYEEKQNQINNKHDKTFIKILDNKKEFIKFLNKILKLKNEINEKNIEKYNSSFVSENFKNQEADIIYKIKGEEIFILIEHQTKIDYKMPLRILKYEMEIIRSRIIKNINNKIVYPVIIPIVLYTGEKRWDASINFEVKNSELAKYRGIKEVRYNLVDINEYSKEELLKEKNILSKIMVIEKSKTIEELKNNVEKIVQEVCISNNEYDNEQKKLLINILEYTLNNIIDKNKIEEYKIKLEGEKNMLAVFDMVEREKRNSYINGVKEGIEKGTKDGIIEGKKEGKKEGLKEGIKMIAKKMIKMNIDRDIIIKTTGLNEKEINELK